MLSSLHIENIAVIKCIDIDFSRGFNVLTGETGAGKSIIIDSINLIMGARADNDLIRSGEERAYVSALFSGVDERTGARCAECGIACDDGELMLSRELTKDGKSVAKINGRTVPVSVLREIATALVTIHGQHDNQSLLKAESHLFFLDAFADTAALFDEYTRCYAEYISAKGELEKCLTDEKEKARRAELIAYQLEDIEGAKLKAGEEEKLAETKKKIKNLGKINKNTGIVYRALYENDKGITACSLIDRAYSAIEALGDAIDDGQALLSSLDECRSTLANIAARADALTLDLNGDPDVILTKIESRLAQIDKIKRKYGADIEEVFAYRDSLREQLDRIENAAEYEEQLRAALDSAYARTLTAGKALTKKRRESAAILEKKICEQLAYLDMNSVRFCVDFDALAEPTATGIDGVEFLISANAGEDAHSLAKVASGGELARVMLAMKCVLAEADGIDLMIFDEVDTGISGKTSLKIGKKLRELSSGAQVMCVTHSAQIASLAASHLKISKHEHEGRVYCQVHPLSYEGRVEEISRIIGGETITPTIIASAEELLRDAQKLH